MKLLVTGGAGMLGSALCPILRAEGHEVRATDIRLLGPGMERLDVRDGHAVAAYRAGEVVAESGPEKHFVVRAGWMIGGGEREKHRARRGREDLWVR